MKRRVGYVFVAGCLPMVVGGVIYFSSSPAQLILWKGHFVERKGKTGEQRCKKMRDELIACGTNALQPVISDIARGSVWGKGLGYYLPGVVENLGEPARESLLKAIEAEPKVEARTYLIEVLQEAFHDYQRLDQWIETADAGTVSSNRLSRMAAHIAFSFPGAPPVLLSNRVNLEFIGWWKTNKISINL